MSTVLILGAASDMAVAIAKKYAAEGHAIGGGLLLALWSDALVLSEQRL